MPRSCSAVNIVSAGNTLLHRWLVASSLTGLDVDSVSVVHATCGLGEVEGDKIGIECTHTK